MQQNRNVSFFISSWVIPGITILQGKSSDYEGSFDYNHVNGRRIISHAGQQTPHFIKELIDIFVTDPSKKIICIIAPDPAPKPNSLPKLISDSTPF